MKTNFGDSSSLVSSRMTINRSFRHFVVGFGYFLSFLLLVVFLVSWFSFQSPFKKFPLNNSELDHLSKTVLKTAEITSVQSSVKNCTYYSCFDIYKCSHNINKKIGVFIYPLTEFVDEEVINVITIIF